MSVNYIYEKGTEKKNISVPTSWKDVTIDTWIQLVNEDDGTVERRLAILTAIPYEDIIQIPAMQFVKLATSIAFSFDVSPIAEANTTPEKYKNWYIGDQSWEKLEFAKAEIAKCDEKKIYGTDVDAAGLEYSVVVNTIPARDPINASIEIVRIYTGENISGRAVIEVIGLVNFFLSSYINFSNALKN